MDVDSARRIVAAWDGLTADEQKAMRAAAYAIDEEPDVEAGLALHEVRRAEDRLVVHAIERLIAGEIQFVDLHSRTVGGPFILVRDEKTLLPEKLTKVVKYTIAEWRLLALAVPKHTHESIRRVHEAKEVFFGSTVVQDTGEPLTPARELFPVKV